MSVKVFVHENVPDRDAFIAGLKPEISVLDFSVSKVDAIRVGFVWENSYAVKQIPFGGNLSESMTYFTQDLIDFFALNPSVSVDLITCSIGANEEFVKEVNRLKIIFPSITFEYSMDETGFGKGNWILESSGLDIKPIYFTEAINDWKHVLLSYILNTVNFTSGSITTRDMAYDGSNTCVAITLGPAKIFTSSNN